jgi:prepilin-type N-terminal cleavage/methylation domain-containing protein
MRTQKAFTLIELLVVIAIIAILAAILFPVFTQAREKARQATCLSQAKQVGLASQMYLQDYDEVWVLFSYGITGPDVHSFGWGAGSALLYWPHTLQPYMKSWQFMVCPNKDYQFLYYGLDDDPNQNSSLCPHCRLQSWCWNSMGDSAAADNGWTRTKMVYPNFNTVGKTGFIGTGVPAGYWTGDAVPDAKVEDHAGTIWLNEGNWPDMGFDVHIDYAWHLPPENNRTICFSGGRPCYKGYRIRARHNEGFLSVYGDGHAKWMRFGSSKPHMWTIQSDDQDYH